MEPITVGIILFTAGCVAVKKAIGPPDKKKKKAESRGFNTPGYDPKRGHPKTEKGRWV